MAIEETGWGGCAATSGLGTVPLSPDMTIKRWSKRSAGVPSLCHLPCVGPVALLTRKAAVHRRRGPCPLSWSLPGLSLPADAQLLGDRPEDGAAPFCP